MSCASSSSSKDKDPNQTQPLTKFSFYCIFDCMKPVENSVPHLNIFLIVNISYKVNFEINNLISVSEVPGVIRLEILYKQGEKKSPTAIFIRVTDGWNF